MSVWVGTSLGNLKQIAYQEKSWGEVQIESLPVSATQQYYICIGHVTTTSAHQTPFDMSVVLPTDSDLVSRNVTAASAENGTFANSLPLSGTSVTVISYALNFAANEPGEPTRNPRYSSWYYYDATADGRIHLSAAGTEQGQYYAPNRYKTLIAYRADTYAEMIDSLPLGTSATTSGLPGTLSFNVVEGQRYYIAFGMGYFSNGSNIGISNPTDAAWRVMTMSYSPLPPSLTTDPVSSITTNSAMAGGEVTGESGAPVTERGVVFGTRWLPSTSNGGTKVVSGSGTGAFFSTLTGLSPSTTYAVRSYAINSAGTGYGPQVEFTTEAALPAVSNALRTAFMRKYKSLKKKLKKTKESSKKKKLKTQLKALKRKIAAL
jgi:hypothetical protein